jgi:hypothetical protein
MTNAAPQYCGWEKQIDVKPGTVEVVPAWRFLLNLQETVL